MQIALGRFDVSVPRERRNGLHGNAACLQHRHIGVAAAMRRKQPPLTDAFQRRVESPTEGTDAIERLFSAAGPDIGRAAVLSKIPNVSLYQLTVME